MSSEQIFCEEESTTTKSYLSNKGFVSATPAYLALFGLDDVEQIKSKHPSELSPEVQPCGLNSFEKANQLMERAQQTGYERFVWCHKKATGEDFLTLITLEKDLSDSPFELIADLVELDLESDLCHQVALLLFDTSSDGILITNDATEIILVNQAFCDISGYSMEESIGQKSGFMKSGRHTDNFYKEMWRILTEQGCWEGEIWDRHKSGKIYPKHLKITSIKNKKGEIKLYIGIFKDTSEQIAYELKLRKMAHYDALTSLPNRRLIMERLRDKTESVPEQQNNFHLIIIDVDNFKQVNDLYGHPVGDELLKFVATEIKSFTKGNDFCGRLGGDEFLLVVEERSHLSLQQLMEKLQQSLCKHITLSDQTLESSCSFGVSSYPQHAHTSHDLMKFADIALYKVKQAGESKFEVFIPEYWSEVVQQNMIADEIKEALSKRQFTPYFQPQFDTKSLKIVGFEALARWNHPSKGVLAPGYFIEVATHKKLIAAISEQIFEEVCKFIRNHNLPEEFTVSVNVCAEQLADNNFQRKVVDTFKEYEINPQQLEFEVTESSMIKDIQTAKNLLKNFRSLGVNIALDDFGKGYSSLAQIKALPLDVLKIDKLFIDEIVSENTVDRSLVKAIVQMAQELGITVIAEGVETAKQLKVLQEIGCDIVQGFMFSKPRPWSELESFIHKPEEFIG